MILAIAVLTALAVLLSAPLDPGSRLRELLVRRGDGDASGPAAADPAGSRRDQSRRDQSRRDQSRRRRADGADPEQDRLWAISAVESCAHLLRVGMSPQAVMATLSRQHARLRPISRAIALGEDPGRAVATRHEDLPPAAAEVFAGMAAVWTVSERSGAPAADMILRYAAAQRDALDADRERRIAMAGPRATVRVLSWLPLIGVGLGLLIGVEPVDLVAGLPGRLSIGSGVVLYLLGRVWMRRMMQRAQR